MNQPPTPEPSVWVELGEDQIGRPMWKAAHLSPDAIKGEHRRVPCVSVDQMRSYGESCARMAREEERERCARICEELIGFDEDDPGQAPADHIRIGAEPGEWVRDHAERAAAIRKG